MQLVQSSALSSCYATHIELDMGSRTQMENYLRGFRRSVPRLLTAPLRATRFLSPGDSHARKVAYVPRSWLTFQALHNLGDPRAKL